MHRRIHNQVDTKVGTTYLSLMGDPTLRLQVLRPPSGISHSLSGGVTLSWSASPDASQYFVYRSTTGISGSWTKLPGNPATGTSFNDSAPPAGPKLYQVRSLALKLTGSGSYTNLSQGVFYLVN